MATSAEDNEKHWLEISDYRHPGGWLTSDAGTRARWYCRQLEEGQILFFAGIPFDFPEDEREFLLSQRQTDSRFHKNISYRPAIDLLKGVSSDSPDRERLHRVMRHYSTQVTDFVGQFLSPYAGKLVMDFASFRPLEEAGRDLPLRQRNDLLHVDAFPSRPTRGARILRVFTNINPAASRKWLTGERFASLAQKYAAGAKLDAFANPSTGQRLQSKIAHWVHASGLPVPDRSAYDRFMLRFHDYLKENSEFQNSPQKSRVEFPPNCTWMVYTDGVPHAVLSGQFALEQTYIVPVEALVTPEAAPIRVLENLAGKAMTG